MSLIRDLERRIDESLRRLFREDAEPSRRRELIELQQAVFDAVDRRVQNLPRARRVFPFDEVLVQIPVHDEEHRAAAEMVFVTGGALREEIVEHLRRDNIEFPPGIRVDVSLVQTAEIPDPVVVCRKSDPAPQTARVEPLRPRQSACLVLSSGEAVPLSGSRIYIGRTAEVTDDHRRLVRRNHVVIGGSTVSRAHAHIEVRDGEYRLFDDSSKFGTSILRGGAPIELPRSGGRGLALQDGDELSFGEARVRFSFVPPETS